MRATRILPFVALAALGLGGCIPYTVGSTAQPVPRGEYRSSTSMYFIPNGFESMADSVYGGGGGAAYAAVDTEIRWGVDERSDVGVRVPSASGIVVNYKRRLTESPDSAAPAVAAMVGGGIVNLGNHAHLEATLLASGRQRETLTPYGGVRAMHVLPLSTLAVRDRPTLGVFAGVRIGSAEAGVSPELAVYYDHSALGIRQSNVVVVPSFTMHGRRFARLLRGIVPLQR